MRCNAFYSADMRKRLEGVGGAAGVALIEDSRHQDALGKLSRHEAALMNALTKTLQMLHFIQSQRPARMIQLSMLLPFHRGKKLSCESWVPPPFFRDNHALEE